MFLKENGKMTNKEKIKTFTNIRLGIQKNICFYILYANKKLVKKTKLK